MYQLGKDVKETTGFQPMNAGIRENIKITGAEFSVHEPFGADSGKVIKISFEDEFGGTHVELLQDVDTDRIREWNDGTRTHSRDDQVNGFIKGQPITDDDAVILAQQRWMQRVKHIAMRVATEAEIAEATKGVTSYEEFAEAYIGLFSDERINKVRLRLKVTLNKKDYTQLPQFPPFVESMKVPKEASRLEINPKYDRVDKVNVDKSDDPTDFDPTTFGDDPGF